MKQGIRILGIDDSPFEKSQREKVLVVGVVWRRGVVEGVLSTKIKKDGDDSTRKLSEMIERSRFKEGLRAILINSITLAGFNIIDINKLSNKLRVPVITIVRKKPGPEKVKNALAHLNHCEEKLALIEKAGKHAAIKGFYVQFCGASEETVEKILGICGIEPVRLAHIISSGVVKGESRGRV